MGKRRQMKKRKKTRNEKEMKITELNSENGGSLISTAPTQCGMCY